MEDEAKVEGADKVDRALMVDADVVDVVAAAVDGVVPDMVASLLDLGSSLLRSTRWIPSRGLDVREEGL